MQQPKPKRFYTTVNVAPQQDGTFHILLDDKTLRTPARNTLAVTSAALADLLRAEWDAQTDHVDADAMPIMRIHAIAIDRVPHDRALITDDMLRYLETDLVCYFSDDGEIAARQLQHFTPLLDWFAAHYGAALQTTDGLMPVAQPEALFTRIRSELDALDALSLAALALMTPLVGSIVLALAMQHRVMTLDALLVAARIEEDMQAERYGLDPLVAAAWEPKKRDIIGAAAIISVR